MKTDWSDASSAGLRTVELYDLGELLHNLHRGKRCRSKRLSRAERLEDVRVLNGAKVSESSYSASVSSKRMEISIHVLVVAISG